TGVVSGTPTTLGTATFVIRAHNAAGNALTPTLKVVTAAGKSPAFSADAPPAGAWQHAYAYTFVASGNPAPTYAVASGALPPGLTLDPDTGVLSGAPAAVGT